MNTSQDSGFFSVEVFSSIFTRDACTVQPVCWNCCVLCASVLFLSCALPFSCTANL